MAGHRIGGLEGCTVAAKLDWNSFNGKKMFQERDSEDGNETHRGSGDKKDRKQNKKRNNNKKKRKKKTRLVDGRRTELRSCNYLLLFWFRNGN